MQHVKLGRTGLSVSRLCLGTMNFGPQTTPEDSHAIMDAALDAELNFFDTADVYGWKPGEGWTEQIIGDWFAGGGARRDRTVLATKVFGGMEFKGQSNVTLRGGLSARKIRLCCEASLRRLQTDYIDLYQMHHIDRSCPWDELWQAFDQLIQQGKVLYVGSSNFAGWHVATANQEAAKLGMLGLVSEQTRYNLFTRQPELEVLPACRHYGVGVIPWSPLAGGYLGGALGKYEQGRRSGANFEKFVESHREQLEKYEALCEKLGQPPAVVALAWLLHQEGVTAPIIGPRTMDQLHSATAALEVELDEQTLQALDAIFPGPGGPAPEAYAW